MCRANAWLCSSEQLACSDFCGCVKHGCEDEWNNNVITDDNDEDYQESDAEVGNEETIDMTD